MHPTLHRPVLHAIAALAACACACSAPAQEFDWKKHQGKTLTFLANNNPVANALLKHKSEFEQLTGITLRIDSYQEQQMRQRLLTVLNAHSDEVDVFMSLPSREGLQFSRAGWYADLSELVRDAAPDYDFAGLSPALLRDSSYGRQLAAIPMNVEGPVLYYRKDLFRKCALTLPATLSGIEAVAVKLKSCAPGITPFVSRGLKPALPYTWSGFLHNMGGQYMAQRKSQLCSSQGQAALALYARLLKDHGPPGVVNYSFYQISSLYRSGQAAMAFESSNELRTVMDGGARLHDTAIAVLPAGPGGSHPTAIGWALSISAHSKNQNAAWYFVQWATSPALQAQLALEGVAPPRAALAAAPGYKAWIDEQPVRAEWVAALNELARSGNSTVGHPIAANPAARELIGQAVIELLLGQKDVAQACADADRQLDALIAKD